MSQHSTDQTQDDRPANAGRLQRILPLIVALIPAVCGLGFQVAGPRPQVLKASNPRPPLAFHQYMVNLGAVPVQRSHAATFLFTNRGDQAMKLRRLETSCGCLSQQVDQDVISPGETGQFNLWIQTASQTAGNKQYTCKAVYGPVDQPEIEYKADLVFRITLPKRSVVITPRAMIFHQPNDQVTERSVDISDLRQNRLKVLEATSQSPWLNVSVIPSSGFTNREREEGVVGRLNVAVGAVPPGTHDAVILVTTDDKEFDALTVPVRIFGPATTSDAGSDHTDIKVSRTPNEPEFED